MPIRKTERNQDIYKRWRDGASNTTIALIMGLSATRIKEICRAEDDKHFEGFQHRHIDYMPNRGGALERKL